MGGILLFTTSQLSAQEKKAQQSINYADELIDITQIPTDSISHDDENILCYLIVESMPEFPGGYDALMKYLADHIKYPPEIDHLNISGKVVVQFVIEKDGSTAEPTIIRSLHPALDSAVIDVILNMPQWKPSYQKGIPVRCKYTIPVHFRLPD